MVSLSISSGAREREMKRRAFRDVQSAAMPTCRKRRHVPPWQDAVGDNKVLDDDVEVRNGRGFVVRKWDNTGVGGVVGRDQYRDRSRREKLFQRRQARQMLIREITGPALPASRQGFLAQRRAGIALKYSWISSDIARRQGSCSGSARWFIHEHQRDLLRSRWIAFLPRLSPATNGLYSR